MESLAIIKLGVKNYLQWIIGEILYFASILIRIVVSILLMTYLFSNSKEIANYNYSEAISYYVLLILFQRIFYTYVNYRIIDEIYSGNLKLKLSLPISIIKQFLYEDIGEKISNSLVVIPTFLFFSIFLKIKFNLLLFLISSIISYLITFFFKFFLSTVSFYTPSGKNFCWLIDSLITILSGTLFPLTFFPFGPFLKYTPLYYFIYYPIALSLGKESISLIFVQLSYLLLFYLTAKTFFNKAVKEFGGENA